MEVVYSCVLQVNKRVRYTVSGSRSPLLILLLYIDVNYVDCGTAVAMTNKVNTNAFDASSIFHDVYINILCKLC